MNPRSCNEVRLRISTAFLLLSLFCLLFELVPHSFIPSVAQAVIRSAFQIPWVAVVFGQLGPVWAAIGAILAIVSLVAHFKKIRTAGQLLAEILLCVIVFALFPVY